MIEVAELSIYTLPYQAVSSSGNPILNVQLKGLQEIKNKVAELIDLRDKGRQDEKIASHGLPLPDTNRHTKEPAITA
jgi:hypothetical protein